MESSPAHPRPRAAIYSRISSDPEGLAHGVQRQEDDCTALAKSLGYEVTEIFRENDLSASTRSKKLRPQYAEMMTMARAGRFEAILAYSNSRLTRRPREVEDLIQLYEHHQVKIQTVVSGDDNLSTADGRMVARIKGNVDAAEAERTAERVSRAKAANAIAGQYRGGVRPYGYEKDGMTIRESEAEVLRYATKAILAGRSLAGLSKEFNERKLTGTRGRPFSYNNLRDLLLRPRNAGLVAHGLPGRKGRASSEPDWSYERDVIGPAQWPAVIDPEEWRALIGILSDPSRRTTTSAETRWLGSGIYTCGVPTGETDDNGTPVVCGSVLRTAPHGGTHSRQGERRYLYRCVASAHLTISAAETDDFVRELVAKMIADPRVLAAMEPGDGKLAVDRDRRSALTARLDAFERDYALGNITGAQLAKATGMVNAELAEVDARLSSAIRRTASSSVARAANPSKAFMAASIDTQRAILATVLKVEVVPLAAVGGQTGRKWYSDRLRFTPVA